MALFVRQTEPRSELRTKVSADLQERMRRTADVAGPQDVSKDASILENQHQTNGLGIIIVVVIIVVLLIGGFFLLKD